MAQLAYINFDLQVERIARNRYRAQVLDSSSGQAEHEFRWNFTPLQLDDFYRQMGQSRQGLREANTRLDATTVERTRDLGERMFTSLFGPAIYACYRSSLDNAREQGKGLRIRLRLDAELATLPWEFLYDPHVKMFLSRSIDTPIVRYIELPYKEPVLCVKPPLNMLVMIANPKGDLDVEKEWLLLSQALAPLQTRGLLNIERLEGASFSHLQRRLRHGGTHIFHFIGHGDYDEAGQSGGLLFEGDGGKPVMLRGDQLGPVLHNHKALRLVVLNACEGARTSTKDPFSGVAQRLVQMGLPAVVAMQFPVPDTSAILFATEFYGALADGFPVDAALVEARTALSALANDLEWGTPVYFTRAEDGRVFDIQGDLAGEQMPAPPQVGHSEVFPVPTAHPAADKPSLAAPPSTAAPEAERVSLRPVARSISPTLRWGARLGVLIVLALVVVGLASRQASQYARQTQTAAAAIAAAATATADQTTIVDPATQRPTGTLPPSATATTRPAPSDTPRPSATLTGTAGPTRTPKSTATGTSTSKPTPTATPSATFTATSDPSIPPASPQAGDSWTRPADEMVMVYIPAGEFLMGSANSDRFARGDEKPQHRVSLDAYWIDRIEVTNAMFKRFVAQAQYRWKGAYIGEEDRPVGNISRDDAMAYCKWAGGSLPTEAQWEKAARGAEGQIYPWGNEFDPARLNFCDKNCPYNWAHKTADDGWAKSAPGGSFPSGASPYGVLDMAGNALEWVLDWYGESYYKSSPASNPTGPASGKYRVLRGGSWLDSSGNVRTAGRYGYDPAGRDDILGFRCVR